MNRRGSAVIIAALFGVIFLISGAESLAQAPTSTATSSVPVATPLREVKKPVPDLPFKLNIAIPGFADTLVTGGLLAHYLAAVYKYAISVVALTSTIAFIYGAFLYLVGSSIDNVSKGKKIMVDAVVGLLLTISAVAILRTVNPATTSLQTLDIIAIEQIGLESIRPADFQAVTGGPPPDRKAMLQLAMDTAKKTGIPELPCVVRASMEHESGGRANVIGHDENARQKKFDVRARRNFIGTGIFYSKELFEAIECMVKECQSEGPMNDDVTTFNPSNPPEYGLDWRWSHGIGAGQSTIFTDSKPCSGKNEFGRGFRPPGGNKCFTVPELLKPETQVEIVAGHFAYLFKKNNGDIAGTYVNYAGRIAKDNPIIQSRVKAFEKCRAEGL